VNVCSSAVPSLPPVEIEQLRGLDIGHSIMLADLSIN
jgi:hypothetical protein